MRRSFDLIVLGCSSVVVSGAFLALFFGTEETGVEGNPAWRALLAITYTAVVLVLIPRYRESLYVLRRNWSLVALLFLAVMSSLWAEMPDLVLRRSVGLFGTTVFGIAVAIRLSLQEQLLMLRWLFRVIAILSIASIVLFPGSRISGDGEWMGVFEHKNAMGTVMGLSLLVESQMSGVDRRARVSKVLFMLLYAVLLLKSDSVTPVVALTGTLILLSIYKFASLRLRDRRCSCLRRRIAGCCECGQHNGHIRTLVKLDRKNRDLGLGGLIYPTAANFRVRLFRILARRIPGIVCSQPSSRRPSDVFP